MTKTHAVVNWDESISGKKEFSSINIQEIHAEKLKSNESCSILFDGKEHKAVIQFIGTEEECDNTIKCLQSVGTINVVIRTLNQSSLSQTVEKDQSIIQTELKNLKDKIAEYENIILLRDERIANLCFNIEQKNIENERLRTERGLFENVQYIQIASAIFNAIGSTNDLANLRIMMDRADPQSRRVMISQAFPNYTMPVLLFENTKIYASDPKLTDSSLFRGFVKKLINNKQVWLSSKDATELIERLGTDPPSSFDWRNQGFIGPVQDSFELNNAFIVVSEECVESLYAIQTKNYVNLSVPQISDCCGSQSLGDSFQCIQKKLGGLCTEKDYPNYQGSCVRSCKPIAPVSGSYQVKSGNETDLQFALLQTPVLAGFDSSQPGFLLYRSGIYNDTNCSTTNLIQVLQIVGYGVENGIPFWIAKNNWSTSWGDNGFIRIIRGKNMCGIATFAVSPK